MIEIEYCYRDLAQVKVCSLDHVPANVIRSTHTHTHTREDITWRTPITDINKTMMIDLALYLHVFLHVYMCPFIYECLPLLLLLYSQKYELSCSNWTGQLFMRASAAETRLSYN